MVARGRTQQIDKLTVPRELRFLTSFFAAALVWGFAPPPSFAHGPLNEQIAALSRQIAFSPHDARRRLVRGELHRLHGDRRAAEADFDAAAHLEPSLHDVWVCRGRLWRDEGRLPEALKAVDRFLKHEPLDGETLWLRAQILVDLGRREEAIATMNRSLRIMASPRPVHYLDRARLVAHEDPASTDRAVFGLDEGIERLGPVFSLHVYAIELFERAGRFDQALERLDGLFAVYSRKDVLLARRGDILKAAGRRMDALVAYTECLEAVEQLPATARSKETVQELEMRVRDHLGD